MATKKTKKSTKRSLRTYASACTAIADLHRRKMSPYSIAKKLNAAGYETATGGSTWYYGTVQLVIKALERAQTPTPASAEPPAQPKPPIPTTPATPADSAPAAPTEEQRRGLKRMTRAGWESLPEPVREAVVERIYKRVVGE